MNKNEAGQIARVWAWKSGAPCTGDAANITMQISKDGGALADSDDVNPTELEKGAYYFELTQEETNCNLFIGIPVSATDDVILYPMIIYTGQGLLRGTASQKIGFLLWDGANDEAKTGDAANLTVYLGLDAAALAAADDTSPAEIGGGVYCFTPTQAELMENNLLVVPVSSTSGVYARPVEIALNRPREILPITVTVDDSPLSVTVETNSIDISIDVDDISVAVNAGRLEVAMVVNVVNVSVDVEDFLMKVVFGPSSSTDNALVRFDGTTGKLVQDSSIILSDVGLMDFGTGEIEISAGTLTLANDQIGWVKINKTGSSLADLTTRSAADLSSGYLAVARMPNTGTWTFTGTIDISGGTLTLNSDQVSWVSVNKTGSSLADLATRSAGDLSSGNLAVARMPSSGTWSFTGTIDISSGSLTLTTSGGGTSYLTFTGDGGSTLYAWIHEETIAGESVYSWRIDSSAPA